MVGTRKTRNDVNLLRETNRRSPEQPVRPPRGKLPIRAVWLAPGQEHSLFLRFLDYGRRPLSTFQRTHVTLAMSAHSAVTTIRPTGSKVNEALHWIWDYWRKKAKRSRRWRVWLFKKKKSCRNPTQATRTRPTSHHHEPKTRQSVCFNHERTQWLWSFNRASLLFFVVVLSVFPGLGTQKNRMLYYIKNS